MSSDVPASYRREVITRKRLLLVLFAVLWIIPELLAHISDSDDVGSMFKSPISLIDVVLIFMVVASFIQGLRGSSRRFHELAALFTVIGVIMLVMTFVAPNGPFQLAAVAVDFFAMAIVLVLLASEVRDEETREIVEDPELMDSLRRSLLEARSGETVPLEDIEDELRRPTPDP